MRDTIRTVARGLPAFLAILTLAGCGGGGGATATAGFDALPSISAEAAPRLDIPAAKSGLKLLVFPAQAGHPVLEAIQRAQSTLDVQMYMMSDEEVINGIIATAKRGVKVRVLLDPRPYTGTPEPGQPVVNPNYDAMRAFKGTPVQLDWTSPQFRYTHQKSMIINKAEAWIMTANMSRSARVNNREYVVIATNKKDVAEVQRLFDSDWTNKPYTPSASTPYLVISPENARQKLLELISAAKRSLSVGIEVLGDPEVHAALIAKAKSKVPVKVLIADPSKYPDSKTPIFAKELKSGGCNVRYLATPVHHAKLIIADDQVAFTGSENLSSNSLDNNRELGIMIAQPDVLQGIISTFTQDWNAGGPIG